MCLCRCASPPPLQRAAAGPYLFRSCVRWRQQLVHRRSGAAPRQHVRRARRRPCTRARCLRPLGRCLCCRLAASPHLCLREGGTMRLSTAETGDGRHLPPPPPLSRSYGREKVEGEAAITACWPLHVILRPSIVYGPLPRHPIRRRQFLQFVDSTLASQVRSAGGLGRRPGCAGGEGAANARRSGLGHCAGLPAQTKTSREGGGGGGSVCTAPTHS